MTGYCGGNLGETDVKISESNKSVDRKPGKPAHQRQHITHESGVNKRSTVQITDKPSKL